MSEQIKDLASFLDNILTIVKKDESYREEIIRQALGHWKEASFPARRQLEQTIRGHIQINGFRNPLKAPVRLLGQEIKAVTYYSDQLLKAILKVWEETKGELKVEILEYLNQQCIGPKKIVECLANSLEDPGNCGYLLQQVEDAVAFLVAERGYCQNDVRLLIASLIEEAILSAMEEGDEITEEGDEVKEEGSVEEKEEKGLGVGLLWHKWLEELKALPAEAPEWESVNDFINQLKELAESKSREKDSVLELLQHDLRKLQKEWAKELIFFGITNTDQWDVRNCSYQQATEACDRIERLFELFGFYQELRQTGATIHEERERRKKQEELEEKIQQIYQELTEVFLPASCIPGKADREEKGEQQCQEKGKAEEDDHVEKGNNLEQQLPKLDSSPPPFSLLEHEEISLISPSTEKNGTNQSPFASLEVAVAQPENQRTAVVPESQPPEKISLRLVKEKRASAHDIAVTLFSHDGLDNWNDFFWSLIIEDDLAGAYWLARSLEEKYASSPLQYWLLQALQGARWLNLDSDLFVQDLLEIARNHQPENDEVQELLGLAAALCPTLIAPKSGLMGWLKVPGNHPFLHSLIETIKTFAQLGVPIQRTDLLSVSGIELREQTIREASLKVKDWLEGARGRRTKLNRATAVWQDLIDSKGQLGAILLLVAEDRRDRVQLVRQEIDNWFQRDFVTDQINAVDRKLMGKKYNLITGDPREQIIRYVRDGCFLAIRWCELVEQEKDIERLGRNWLAERITELRQGVQKALAEEEESWRNLTSKPAPISLLAGGYCLLRAAGQLCRILQLPAEYLKSSLPENRWDWLISEEDTLMKAFRRRLFLFSELTLNDNGEPLALAPIATVLRDAYAQNPSWQEAFMGWLEKKDFRFADQLARALGTEQEYNGLCKKYQEELEGSRAALEDKIRHTEEAIEQAVVDGIIGEERAEYSAQIQAIDVKAVQNFTPCYAVLDQILTRLDTARSERLILLTNQWQSIQERLNEAKIDQNRKAQVQSFVQNALDQGDTRVVEEILSRLARALDTGEEIEDNWFVPRVDERDVFHEFKESLKRIEEELGRDHGVVAVGDAIRNERRWAGLNFGKLPRPRRDEALSAIEAWRRLKQGRMTNKEKVTLITYILHYLGFNIEPGLKVPANNLYASDYYFYMSRVPMSAGGLAPVPQFGSQQQGVYDVICLWERPSVDTMSAWLRDLKLDNRNVLVFYLGRMSLERRHVMKQLSIERGLTMAVLDEILLVFLAAERTARLSSFFKCSLPFTAVNPYTPFQAGDVPQEMFFGREDMVRKLQRPEESCVVYGGRQLGKSALLRYVQREFHQPQNDQYAYVEDIKIVGDPKTGQPTSVIWKKLRDVFKMLGLLPPKINTDLPDEIITHLRNVLEKNPRYRVLVLFDEADNFLDADARDNFCIVDQLRILMQNTQRRFKVVFAGLHNVQRFQGLANQPLAQFGAPMRVGPLEPGAAQELIRKPLSSLGYRFKDDALILRILSYTNYHPGLIQLFCQKLLIRLHNKARREKPQYPYVIDRSDIEAVYRMQEIREQFKERFDWTLALDKRYQAIAWTIIYDHLDKRDVFAQSYRATDILRMASEWWEQGFGQIRSDEFRGLLDEMCGLGVLWRSNEGYYHLRSPNLVRIIGTKDHIEERLLELSYASPDDQNDDPNNYHAPLDCNGRYYNPLSFGQERSLNTRQFGVGLLFASGALGLNRFVEAFRSLVTGEPTEVTAGVWGDLASIPPEVNDAGKMRIWLEDYLKMHSGYGRLVVYREMKGSAKEIEPLINSAVRICQKYKGKKKGQWLRVLFVFPPKATWEWLTLPATDRKELENQVDVVLWPRRWNLAAIKQRIVQRNKMDSKDVCEQVFQTTGGWPYLLDELFIRCGEADDPRPFCCQIDNELKEMGSPLRQNFWSQLGLEINEHIEKLARFIIQEKSIPLELATPEHICELLSSGQPASEKVWAAVLEYLQMMGLTEIHPEEGLILEPIVERLLKV
ncbi:MAG: ATP-binding protein [Armatimonadetes bacterium]|nr:ATP-binding protein [Armatimonadota bacterium]